MTPVKGKVSIITPSRNERFMPPTVVDLLNKAAGDIEVIVVLDGYWHDATTLPDDKRLVMLHRGEAQGMRSGINHATRIARGEYLLKIDSHCMVAEGFDETLKKECADNWVVVPRRLSLDAEKWAIKDTGKSPVDAHYLSYPYEEGRAGCGLHGTVWTERARQRKAKLVDDEMSSQGSCWFMTRRWWDYRFEGRLDPAIYGSFVQEFQEIGCKTWLGGGEVKVNKKTWYAHLHKGQQYGRGYFISKGEMSEGAKACVLHWMNNRWPERQQEIRWLIEKFWPVPSWPTIDGALDWATVEKETAEFTRRVELGEPVHI